ncbi:MAG: acetyl-CoA carboxylase, carboxyltransferase subunit beta [Gemmatimonadales bacterium]
MAWFRKERKPRRSQRERLDIPPDAWDKCPQCGHVDLTEKFEASYNVCPECGHHGKIGARRYLELLTDEGSFEEKFLELKSVNPLQFEGYEERLQRALRKAGDQEAIATGRAAICGIAVNIGVMEFGFMGGSMGSVVGEKIARLAQNSVDDKVPLILVSSSGGARMQEGVLSLMQLAKTSAMIAAVKENGIPFISIMTNPTTGGVSASYAMQGDVNIGEPRAVIGFAGPRVIKQTIGQDLPEGFQTAEFLLEHGMLDLVAGRLELRDKVAALLRMMLALEPAEK